MDLSLFATVCIDHVNLGHMLAWFVQRAEKAVFSNCLFTGPEMPHIQENIDVWLSFVHVIHSPQAHFSLFNVHDGMSQILVL